MDERLMEIEIKLAYAEDLIDTLNATVYRQQRQIDSLQEAMLALRQQIVANQPNEARSLRDELPPHY